MLTISAKHAVTMTQLSGIDVPERTNVSKQWRGVRHADLATAILEGCADEGLDVRDTQWGVNGTGSDLFGGVDITPSPQAGLHLPDGLGLALGVRHSNVGRYAVTFAVGARVFICSNGMIVSDFTVSHKHTVSLVLPELVRLALRRFLDEARGVAEQVETLRALPVNDAQAAVAILDAARFDELPPRYALDVWQAWQTPAHVDFMPRTGWSLHNAFTQVAKTLAPTSQYALLRALPHRVRQAGTAASASASAIDRALSLVLEGSEA